MPVEVPPTVLSWLRNCFPEPLAQKLVPGATEEERSRLRALGGLAGALNSTNAISLPDGVRSWFTNGPRPPIEVEKAARRWVAKDPDAALALLYAGLVASDNRRTLGTFFTPSDEARLMLEMWSASQGEPNEVIDIGAGVGVFTAAARKAWKAARVRAIDVNPVTLGLLALHPQVAADLRATGDEQPGIELVLDDFTKWVHSKDPTGASRLYLGNPPYTRAQLIPADERTRLQEQVGKLCGTRASLSTVITAICMNQLRPNDGMCLLLPAQWLESDYARPLRHHIWEQRNRRIELRLVSSRLFADAQVDAVVLLVGATDNVLQPFAVGDFKGELNEAERSETMPNNWRAMFGPKRRASTYTGAADSLTLGRVAHVRRGMATGANSFFLVTMETAKEHCLPSSVLRPVVRRLHSIRNNASSDLFLNEQSTEPKFALVATAEDRKKHEALDAYLERGEKEEFDQRELCKRRETWFDVSHDAFVPDVIVTAMSRGLFRVVINDASAIITNNLYGWQWRPDVADATKSHIVEWLRSAPGQLALRSVARSQADGLLKLEPRVLRELEVPPAP